MEVALTIGIGIFSFLFGMSTRRIQKFGKITHIILLCTLGFSQGLIFKHYKPSKIKLISVTSIIIGLNIIGKSLQMVGVTGGIGCGKSRVISLIRTNFPNVGIIDCDAIAREIVKPGRRAYKKIVAKFGDEVVMADGTINRQALSDIVFSDRKSRKTIDSIVQPIILLEIVKKLFRFKVNGVKFVVIDAPLLFESKILTYFCCPIITVYINNQELWVKRLCDRDLITTSKAKMKISCQMPIETKIKLSDLVIENSGSFYQLENAVNSIFNKLE
jgi:dephospho-CoA kinase